MRIKLNENQEEDIAQNKKEQSNHNERNITNEENSQMGRKCKPTEEKGNKIKRWRRGTEVIRKSNPRKWLGQGIEEVIDLQELEKKAAYHLDILLDQREALNERKINTRKKLEAMETIKEDERIRLSFFRRMKTNKSKE